MRLGPALANRRSLHQYLTNNRNLWHIFTPLMRKYLEENADKSFAGEFPNNHIRRMESAAREMYKEKKRLEYVHKKADWIEGTDIHNARPDLYVFCKSIKIHTIHALRAFINAARESDSQLHSKLPLAGDLIHYYDEYMRRKV